jgi:hypothetical protein
MSELASESMSQGDVANESMSQGDVANESMSQGDRERHHRACEGMS